MFLAHLKKLAKKHIGLKSTNKYFESGEMGLCKHYKKIWCTFLLQLLLLGGIHIDSREIWVWTDMWEESETDASDSERVEDGTQDGPTSALQNNSLK